MHIFWYYINSDSICTQTFDIHSWGPFWRCHSNAINWEFRWRVLNKKRTRFHKMICKMQIMHWIIRERFARINFKFTSGNLNEYFLFIENDGNDAGGFWTVLKPNSRPVTSPQVSCGWELIEQMLKHDNTTNKANFISANTHLVCGSERLHFIFALKLFEIDFIFH